MTTKFKKSFSPMLICWNDIKIHLGFEDSYFVPPPNNMLVNYFPHLMYFKTEFLFMIVYQCPVGSGTLSEFKDLNNIILV